MISAKRVVNVRQDFIIIFILTDQEIVRHLEVFGVAIGMEGDDIESPMIHHGMTISLTD